MLRGKGLAEECGGKSKGWKHHYTINVRKSFKVNGIIQRLEGTAFVVWHIQVPLCSFGSSQVDKVNCDLRAPSPCLETLLSEGNRLLGDNSLHSDYRQLTNLFARIELNWMAATEHSYRKKLEFTSKAAYKWLTDKSTSRATRKFVLQDMSKCYLELRAELTKWGKMQASSFRSLLVGTVLGNVAVHQTYHFTSTCSMY